MNGKGRIILLDLRRWLVGADYIGEFVSAGGNISLRPEFFFPMPGRLRIINIRSF